VVIATRFLGEGKDPWGGYRAGFEGTTTIKLKDFEIQKDLGPKTQELALIISFEGVQAK
jgi:polyisoprenoid-binding protein YceI